MPIGMLFWLLMVLWFIFGLWWNWPEGSPGPRGFGGMGGHVLTFILFFLLGWRTFGFVVQ